MSLKLEVDRSVPEETRQVGKAAFPKGNVYLWIADRSGFPAAYVGLAGALGILILFLFWKGHRHLLGAQVGTTDQLEVKA